MYSKERPVGQPGTGVTSIKPLLNLAQTGGARQSARRARGEERLSCEEAITNGYARTVGTWPAMSGYRTNLKSWGILNEDMAGHVPTVRAQPFVTTIRSILHLVIVHQLIQTGALGFASQFP